MARVLYEKRNKIGYITLNRLEDFKLIAEAMGVRKAIKENVL